MSNVHPSSKGLRELAAFLDNCAEEGVEIPISPYVHFGSYGYANKEQQRATCAALLSRLNQPMTMPDTPSAWADAKIPANFSGVEAHFNFSASAICEQVEEMQLVKVWQLPALTAATPEAKS